MLLHNNVSFAREPAIKVPRTKFKPPIFDRKTTFNNGDLIPIFAEEMYPGDTLSLDMASVVRMTTPIKPVFDNAFLDVFFFFVPNRLVWKHWREFMGENNTSHWKSSVEYEVPFVTSPGSTSRPGQTISVGSATWFKGPIDLTILDTSRFESLRNRGVLGRVTKGSSNSPTTVTLVPLDEDVSTQYDYYYVFNGWDVGSLADYFGVPVGSYAKISQLYFRAYGLIWNEFFRSEPYMDPVDIKFDSDSDIVGAASTEGGYNPVQFTVLGSRPLKVSRFHDYFSSVLPQPTFDDVKIPFTGLAPVNNMPGAYFQPTFYSGDNSVFTTDHPLAVSGFSSGLASGSGSAGTLTTARMSLGADVASVAGSLMDLRNAFQVLKYQERSARSGTRYIEIIQAQFGVRNPDYRLQRPEYLGGFRKPIQVTQVLQTSSTDAITPQGNTSAYSLTSARESLFTYSSTEHGLVIGLCCCRTSRSYQQSLPRKLTRRRKLDYWFPVFNHISEQPIFNREIFNWYNGLALRDIDTLEDKYSYATQVFGYQESWADLRYMQSTVTGDFRSAAPESLDFWHYADWYETEVYASPDWMLEGPENVDRTLAVTSGVSRQFLADFAFDVSLVRALPMYGVPGFADHF